MKKYYIEPWTRAISYIQLNGGTEEERDGTLR
jgi:hypothetical protein